LLEYSEETSEFEKVKKGIAVLYEELGDSVSPDIKLEAMIYAYSL